MTLENIVIGLKQVVDTEMKVNSKARQITLNHDMG